MDQNLKEKALEKLTKAESIYVVVSKASGLDGLASGLALYLSLVKLGKNASIISTTPSVGDANKIYGVDKIGKLIGKRNLTVVVDNAVESVDKVTYFLDGNRLKVVIHSLAGSNGVSKDQVSLEETVSAAELIFAIGCDSQESLHSEITHEQNISSETLMININNQKSHQKFAQIEVVNDQAATISEVMSKMIQDLALPVDEDIAYNLYIGISEATDNFSPAVASPLSLEMAAWLLKFGASRASFAGMPQRPDLTASVLPKTVQAIPPIGVDYMDKTPTLEELEGKQELKDQSASRDWLKPPKIYKGSKSFDREN